MYTSNDFLCAIYIDKHDILITYCIRIYSVHYAHISKVLSFVDVDGTLPKVMYAIMVYLFCDINPPFLSVSECHILFYNI